MVIVLFYICPEEFSFDLTAFVRIYASLHFKRRFRVIGALREEATQGVHSINATEPPMVIENLHFAFRSNFKCANEGFEHSMCHKPKVVIVDTDGEGFGKP